MKTLKLELFTIQEEKIQQELKKYLEERYSNSPATLQLLEMFNNKHLYFVATQNMFSIILATYDDILQKNIKGEAPPILSFLSSTSLSSGNNLFKAKFELKENVVFFVTEEIEEGASEFFYQIEDAIKSLKASFKEQADKEMEEMLLDSLKVQYDNAVNYINDFCKGYEKSSTPPAENLLIKELCLVFGRGMANTECVYLYNHLFKKG